MKTLAASPFLRDLEWVDVADNRQLAGHRHRVEELLGGRTPTEEPAALEVILTQTTSSYIR